MNMALAGLMILLIGDSHVAATGFFNDPLHDSLIDQGAKVDSFGVCGEPAGAWIQPIPIICGRGERHGRDPAQIGTDKSLTGWALTDLVAQYKPNLVIIDLGDTMAGYGITPELPREAIKSQISQLLAPVVTRRLPCIWIGPPWGKDGGPYKKTNARVKELSDLLAQNVAPCRYIDSLKMSRPGQWATFDGVHLTLEANAMWDNELVRSIVQIARKLPRH